VKWGVSGAVHEQQTDQSAKTTLETSGEQVSFFTFDANLLFKTSLPTPRAAEEEVEPI